MMDECLSKIWGIYTMTYLIQKLIHMRLIFDKSTQTIQWSKDYPQMILTKLDVGI